MKKCILAIFLSIVLGCKEKPKEFRYRLNVVNDEDSTENFSIFSDFIPDYNFYTNEYIDSIIFNKKSLTKVEGEFIFGFINKKNEINKILFFSADSTKMPKNSVHHVLIDEFNIMNRNELFISSLSASDSITNDYKLKKLVYLITGNNKSDTIGYQESNIIKTERKLITMVLIYTDLVYRQELIDVANLLKSKQR